MWLQRPPAACRPVAGPSPPGPRTQDRREGQQRGALCSCSSLAALQSLPGFSGMSGDRRRRIRVGDLGGAHSRPWRARGNHSCRGNRRGQGNRRCRCGRTARPYPCPRSKGTWSSPAGRPGRPGDTAQLAGTGLLPRRRVPPGTPLPVAPRRGLFRCRRHTPPGPGALWPRRSTRPTPLSSSQRPPNGALSVSGSLRDHPGARCPCRIPRPGLAPSGGRGRHIRRGGGSSRKAASAALA